MRLSAAIAAMRAVASTSPFLPEPFSTNVRVARDILTAALATDMTSAQFREGLRLGFTYFQVVYCLLKAFLFGGAIAFLCSYEGYVTTAGAEGVGRATAKAVVIGCVAVLILDALIAILLAPYLQA